jgi:HEPN domain-containing protein
MTKQEKIDFWVKCSDMDFNTMEFMFAGKRYDWSLFIGHLMLEKLLKALFVKNNPAEIAPPKIHKLVALAEKSHLPLTKEQENDLNTFTTFQINARYQDYKLKFYKQCTLKYTQPKIEKIKETRQWLKKQIY